jgi:hypothetical protein
MELIQLDIKCQKNASVQSKLLIWKIKSKNQSEVQSLPLHSQQKEIQKHLINLTVQL